MPFEKTKATKPESFSIPSESATPTATANERDVSGFGIGLYYLYASPAYHFFWMSFGNLRNQPYNMFIFQVANLMQILNSALNPVVYGTLNNDIKRGFISVFKRKSQARDRFQLWSRKPIELQTMASNCTSPLLQKRFSLPTLHYEEDKSRAKHRNGKNLIAQRNQAESDGSKNKRSIIYSFEKRSASSEKIEFKDNVHI